MQSYNSPGACTQTGERMQVWHKDATLYQTILKPQAPLMLRNPGFLSFSCPAASLSSEEAVTKGEAEPEAVECTGAI